MTAQTPFLHVEAFGSELRISDTSLERHLNWLYLRGLIAAIRKPLLQHGLLPRIGREYYLNLAQALSVCDVVLDGPARAKRAQLRVALTSPVKHRWAAPGVMCVCTDDDWRGLGNGRAPRLGKICKITGVSYIGNAAYVSLGGYADRYEAAAFRRVDASELTLASKSSGFDHIEIVISRRHERAGAAANA